MAEKPMISVIVPVYNVENYICQCLDSLRAQTFRDFEAILVDDGSKDATKAIAEEYIKKHALDNFRLISKANGGVSSARNCALKEARGEWIFFLDGDDWLDKNCFSELTAVVQKHPADLIFGGYQAYDHGSGQTEVWSNYDREFGCFPEDIEGLDSFSFLFPRLFKKEIIDQYGIRFDETLKYCEDSAWHFNYNKHIRSYACTNAVVYNYRINRSGSLTGGLVAPDQKRNLWKHAEDFCLSAGDEAVFKGIENSIALIRVLWNAVITEISVLVMEKQYRQAKAFRAKDVVGKVIRNYEARSRKEKVFLLMLKFPFPILYLFISVYYGNFEKIRSSKLMKLISKAK